MTLKTLLILIAAVVAAYYLVPVLQRRYGRTERVRLAILVAVVIALAFIAFALSVVTTI
jgi:Kef-type K+ transport system membrane component KefB